MFPELGSIKQQGARIRKNASMAAQTYQCNKSIYRLSVFSLLQNCICPYFSVYVRKFLTVFPRIWVTCILHNNCLVSVGYLVVGYSDDIAQV